MHRSNNFGRASLVIAALGVGLVATPADAGHRFHTEIPYETRGECEAARAELSNNDYWLLEAFPDMFSSKGEVRRFLNKAYTCELSDSDGKWYITDQVH